jgi:asparagine synthase (glutamine-hydrolysing)
MCGICGVVQVAGEPRQVVEPAVLDRMTDVMRHRGPNDRGTYMADGIALGVRRLSIVDVAGGHQPVSNEDGTIWAIQNGELYNHADERPKLERRGHRLRSRCDTEILPHLYEDAGPAFPDRLRGMFGIAVWDGRERRAVLARDRLGIKPLYYAHVGDLLVFGSELKSVLASGLVGPELDYEGIDAYLRLTYFPGPRTPLAQVSKLLPGSRLVVQRGTVRTERYWSYPLPVTETPLRDEREYARLLLQELEESVRLRLMSDVPLGAMLSGGLDSSLIVALMARHMSEPVKTFAVGFREAGKENELAIARRVSQALGTEHHEIELSFADEAVELADLVWSMDEPLADLSSLGFLALCQLASEHVTVALSGQGADELLGGYRKHQAASLAGQLRRLPGAHRLAGLPVPESIGRALRTVAAPDAAARLLAMSGHMDDATRAALVRGALAELDGRGLERSVRELAHGAPDDPLPAALYVDAQIGLVDDMLHYFDRGSMAHSLEVRVPFLDHHVVELCARIPGTMKVKGLTTKHVLKQAARGLVPDEVIDRPKVGFFNAVADRWFRAQLSGPVQELLLTGSPRYAEFLDRDEVARLLRACAQGDTTPSYLLLSVLLLEVWLSSYLPRALTPPPASHDAAPPRVAAGAG